LLVSSKTKVHQYLTAKLTVDNAAYKHAVVRERFLSRGGEGAENIEYKFRFSPKLLNICIYQKSPQPPLGDFWDLLRK